MKKSVLIFLAAIILSSGCTSTRYITDKRSRETQLSLQRRRTGRNAGLVVINFLKIIITSACDEVYEAERQERQYKRFKVWNSSADTLYVNMVTDITLKDQQYCDVMGLVLPPAKKQRLLLPYPAAYNVYFRSAWSDEEKIEIRTDSYLKKIYLSPGLTKPEEKEAFD